MLGRFHPKAGSLQAMSVVHRNVSWLAAPVQANSQGGAILLRASIEALNLELALLESGHSICASTIVPKRESRLGATGAILPSRPNRAQIWLFFYATKLPIGVQITACGRHPAEPQFRPRPARLALELARHRDAVSDRHADHAGYGIGITRDTGDIEFVGHIATK